MKTAVITNSRILSLTANSIQAMKVIQALMQLDHDVRMFAPAETDFRLLLRTLDVLVSPAVEEKPRFSVLEAMACARPVIASAGGSVFSVVRDGENGLVVPRGDAPALSTAIVSLLRDRTRAAALGAGARRSVEERHDLAQRARELAEVHRRAAAGSG